MTFDGKQFTGRLSDGRRIAFRTIRPEDKLPLQEGLRKLSPLSRYRRFHSDIDRLSERQLRYLTEPDFENHVAWVAVLPTADGEEGIGVGRWIRTAEDPEVAEVALTVLDAYQGQGVGKALLWLLATSAGEKGIRAFRVGALAENRSVLHLLKEVDAQPGDWHQGVLEALAPLPGQHSERLKTLFAPGLALYD